MFELKKIDYCFPNSQSLFFKNLSLQIPKGSMVAIMGLNGSGKTTLLKLLSSQIRTLKGDVLINQNNINTLQQNHIAQQMAYVPQELINHFPFTVFEFVMMGRFVWQKGLFNTQEDINTTQQVMNKLKLTHLKNRTLNTLSGGEKQRALLAKAIIQNTPAILLDEPCNHLDIKNKKEFLEIILKEHEQNNKTIIAVMHDFYDVKKYFKDVVFIKKGQVHYYGPVANGFKPNRLKETFEIDVTIN